MDHERAFKYVDQLSAHMDEGGITGANNVRDLIQMVRELVSDKVILENDLFQARKDVEIKCCGCGAAIPNSSQMYRCTDCSQPFHKDCARQHFGSGTTIEQLRELTALQAEDDALWSAAGNIEHAYCQQGLRLLTTVIEGKSTFEQAREAIHEMAA